MPPQDSSCSDTKQMYINGHFYYADKFTILTNGLRIVRHISFIDDKDFKAAHPELIIKKKSDSPDKDKSVGNSKSLVPVLTDFLHFTLIFTRILSLVILLLILQNSMAL